MKDILMLWLENKRLKKRVSELENQIANINKWNNENLKNLKQELAVLLEVLNNGKA